MSTLAPSPTIAGCRSTRIYCRPDCVPGRRTRPENRVPFASREEARTSGYRPCKVCKPDGENAEPETFLVSHYQSPLGTYLLASSPRGMVCVEPADQVQPRLRRWERDGIRVEEGAGTQHNVAAAGELDRYFGGELRQFTVPLDMRGTAFDRQVWGALRDIPYAETRSYGQVAQAIGRPTASRAVGHANGRNPVSIIVPCHRVIGTSGALVGYGGGLDRKDSLLQLERRDHHGQKP
jgi:O-6-methylguanine DNA methyltransferase